MVKLFYIELFIKETSALWDFETASNFPSFDFFD